MLHAMRLFRTVALQNKQAWHPFDRVLHLYLNERFDLFLIPYTVSYVSVTTSKNYPNFVASSWIATPMNWQMPMIPSAWTFHDRWFCFPHFPCFTSGFCSCRHFFFLLIFFYERSIWFLAQRIIYSTSADYCWSTSNSISIGLIYYVSVRSWWNEVCVPKEDSVRNSSSSLSVGPNSPDRYLLLPKMPLRTFSSSTVPVIVDFYSLYKFGSVQRTVPSLLR